MLFPLRNMAQHACTGLDLEWSPSGLPWVTWLGHLPAGIPAHAMGAAPGQVRHMPLLGEHGHVRYTRPHLRGHRLGPDGTAGHAWSTRFITLILPVTVFLFLQRYFVRGLTAGAVKG